MSAPMTNPCDNSPQLPSSVHLAPFVTDGENVPMNTLSPSLGTLTASLSESRIAWSLKNMADMVARKNTGAILTKLRQIHFEMDERGFLNDNRSALWYWDFDSRNILVDRTEAEEDWKFAAVLNWDGVLSVPRSATREPPGWLWHLVSRHLNGAAIWTCQLRRTSRLRRCL